MCGASFGRSRITVTSAFETDQPSAAAIATPASEQVETGSVLPRGIGVRKMLADIPGPGRAEDRVHERVAHHVAIRMTVGPPVERHHHASEHQRASLDQPMQVVSGADRAIPTGSARARPPDRRAS